MLHSIILLRFANIFFNSQPNYTLFQINGVIQNVKFGLSIDNTCYDNGFYHSSIQESNVKAVEQKIPIRKDERIHYDDMTDTMLNNAASMFLYLNSCSDLYTPWFVFYKDLFQNKSPSQIVLTLNRILKSKSTLQTEKFRGIAKNLFEAITNVYSLKYNDIQNITSMRNNDRNNRSTLNIMNGNKSYFKIAYILFRFKVFFINLYFIRYSKCQQSCAFNR